MQETENTVPPERLSGSMPFQGLRRPPGCAGRPDWVWEPAGCAGEGPPYKAFASGIAPGGRQRPGSRLLRKAFAETGLCPVTG